MIQGKLNYNRGAILVKNRLTPIAVALCLTGFIMPVSAAVSSDDQARIDELQSQLSSIQKEVKTLKANARSKKRKASRHVTSRSSASHVQSGMSWREMFGEDHGFLPIDLDVPGKAFVSTGPYVGVPLQFAGNDLIINSPSVNTDVQLLDVRKEITNQLHAMGGERAKESDHSHLLLSGVVEAQANYTNKGGSPSTTDVSVTNVSIDSIFLGPSSWTLGFIELSYDDAAPVSSVYTSNSNYRNSNSRVYVNKAFITIGDFSQSPFYGSVGQFYVPFGTYSSTMVTSPLTKAMMRTKARAILLGFQQQDKNAFYGSAYLFRGDSHANSVAKVNNGGLNVGYKFKGDTVSGKVGGGVIANIADSAGMQSSGFSSNEQLVHRVPGYNLRGLLSFGQHVDVIGEFVSATTNFNPYDMSYNGHGAKPWATALEADYSFTILNDKPSSIGIGYSQTHEALSLGLPLSRYSMTFNTSLWRNTIESLEFRHDLEYASTATATAAANSAVARQTGKADNAVTAQFDYYF